MLVFFLWFCIFIPWASPDSLDTGTAGQTDESARIKKELDEKRKSMEKLSLKERNTFEELLDLEEKLELIQRLIESMSAGEENTERELQVEAKNLKETRLKLNQHRESSLKRLREIYKHGRFVPSAMILEASSPVDLMNRIRFSQKIIEKDHKFSIEKERLTLHLEEKRLNLNETKSELSRLASRKSEEQEAYHKELKKREKLLKKIRSEKKLYAQAVGDLEESANQIPQIMNQLTKERTLVNSQDPRSKIRFETSKGKLPWPIEGRVISTFGEQKHPRFHTKTEKSGIEIEAKPGARIVAVARGKVNYTSRLRGYGNLLILDHGDEYYTLYAHLSEILVSPGEEVERLQEIGVVGEGKLISSPCLHFEIRKGKQPQDPLEWLR